jgi:DNA-3-methyladenine glycosylase
MTERAFFGASSLDLAPLLLGGRLTHVTDEGAVTVRITELEAYLGDADPGSHAFRGRTPRNAVMFGEPGHLYAYFTYGMHVCANIVCSPAGTATALLVRAGEVVEGVEIARRRRGAGVRDRELARGPARLVVAMGIRLDDDGADLLAPPFDLEPPTAAAAFASGPRTGLSGPGGGDDYPWRFWIPGDETVSPYRPHVPRRRPAEPAAR